jgi:hypothetical protein
VCVVHACSYKCPRATCILQPTTFQEIGRPGQEYSCCLPVGPGHYVQDSGRRTNLASAHQRATAYACLHALHTCMRAYMHTEVKTPMQITVRVNSIRWFQPGRVSQSRCPGAKMCDGVGTPFGLMSVSTRRANARQLLIPLPGPSMQPLHRARRYALPQLATVHSISIKRRTVHSL